MICDLRFANFKALFALSIPSFFVLHSSFAFEGRISARLTHGGDTAALLYTISTNQIRIERGETNRPHAKNIINLDTGVTTILLPHNRSFVRLKTNGSDISP